VELFFVHLSGSTPSPSNKRSTLRTQRFLCCSRWW